jgi:hypothetical protein
MNTKEIVIGSKDILEAKICLKGAAVTELNLFWHKCDIIT